MTMHTFIPPRAEAAGLPERFSVSIAHMLHVQVTDPKGLPSWQPLARGVL
jgi:hypothetical protein